MLIFLETVHRSFEIEVFGLVLLSGVQVVVQVDFCGRYILVDDLFGGALVLLVYSSANSNCQH